MTVKEFDIENKKLRIHQLKLKDSNNLKVKITNFDGICTITGDLGNYIVCREFIPKPNGYISDYYFIEKLEYCSTQKGLEFDSEDQEEKLKEWQSELLEDVTDEDKIEEIKEQFESLFAACQTDSQWEFESEIYNSDLDFSEFETEKKIKMWLLMIFDAFEEICNRLALNEGVK